MTEQLDFLSGFIVGILCGTLILSIVACEYENKLLNLCNKHKYDFCVEQKQQKQWEIKID